MDVVTGSTDGRGEEGDHVVGSTRLDYRLLAITEGERAPLEGGESIAAESAHAMEELLVPDL